MPTSPKFDYTRQLRVITRQLHNEAVTDFFKGLKDKNGKVLTIPDDSVNTSLASLKTTCKINTEDSIVIQQSKMLLFDLLRTKLAGIESLLDGFYATPIGTFKETVKYVPQINIQLQESYADAVKEKRQQLSMSISFRLAGVSGESIQINDLRNYARNIRDSFIFIDEGKKYTKGGMKYNYRDESKGYRLSLLVDNESTGSELVNDILSIQGHSFDSDLVSVSEVKRRTDTKPNDKFVLGDWRKMPTYRGKGEVRFKRATCNIWEMPKPVILCEIKRGEVITFDDF